MIHLSNQLYVSSGPIKADRRGEAPLRKQAEK